MKFALPSPAVRAFTQGALTLISFSIPIVLK
jgi:hypothetical protein